MTSRLDALKARVDDTELGSSMTLGRITIERLVAVVEAAQKLMSPFGPQTFSPAWRKAWEETENALAYWLAER